MIVGITGTFAAGKDAVAEYLEEKGFEHFSLGHEIVDVAKERGIEPTRDNLRILGNALREEHGSDYLPKRVLEKSTKENVAIAGIRQPGEIEYLRNKPDFILIAVDAPIELRFERMKDRAREGDPQTIEELAEKEKKEMESEGKNVQKIHECMELADYKIVNNGTFEDLHKEVDNAIKGLRQETA
ncbi:MAG: hypothetical protein BWY43_00614 [candidate division WS2 bacterium ADurb.Bin280]|uniref:Dephospho-CoA kinase n=1 Tax=candidate division WS2 bacterium ADurb.Bin280 TaxID=1852829 RepID=A0A1V5SCB5_9BACT|nr:MAG: hypothetical protein BWY43_00614 [candidate division WS2 bacterium ADurb.Bin280]